MLFNRKIKVGVPNDSSTNMGALVSKEHLTKVTGYINLAKQEGGTIVCGQDVDPPIKLPDKNQAVMSTSHHHHLF
jgi:acyl-CoA reductase-like NAD-dependent aldehyde dehydrogenase